MTCVGGIIQRMGASPEVRAATFYGVCIPLRLCLAVAVLALGRQNPKGVVVAVLAIATLSCFFLLHQDNSACKVWWSRRMHAGITLLLALLAVLVIYGIMPVTVLAAGVALDAVAGFVSSFLFAGALT